MENSTPTPHPPPHNRECACSEVFLHRVDRHHTAPEGHGPVPHPQPTVTELLLGPWSLMATLTLVEALLFGAFFQQIFILVHLLPAVGSHWRMEPT